MKVLVKSLVFSFVVLLSSMLIAQDLAQHLQDVSVTINAGYSSGSGVLITREVEGQKINFVWTAGHVIDGLKVVREVIDPKTGSTIKLIEFKPVHITKELSERGRKVGEINMECKVLKYSDAENGEDLALLMVLKRDFVSTSTEFYLEDDIPNVGTNLFHVGSLLGQSGANSMTAGIVSQVGRVITFGGNSVVFDQVTTPSFPGSSGGGVFLAEGENKGKYVGMVVRGAGETFVLTVPVRRMREWAEKSDLMWALDASLPVPSLADINDILIENVNVRSTSKRHVEIQEEPASSDSDEDVSEFNFLIGKNK